MAKVSWKKVCRSKKHGGLFVASTNGGMKLALLTCKNSKLNEGRSSTVWKDTVNLDDQEGLCSIFGEYE